MGNFGNTLASTIQPDEVLPPWLDFETHPEDGEALMYESAYYESYDNSDVWKMNETRGVRQIISKYIDEVPEEERSWEKFVDGGYNTLDIPQSEYKTQMRDVEKGYYSNTRGPATKKADSAEEEIIERPTFNADDPNADPLLVKLMKKKLAQAENATSSVKDVVEEKYYAIFDAAKRLANGRSLKHHVFICGDAGVGKSYMVERAIEEGQAQWRPNPRDREKPEFIGLHGSVGNSMTNILLFFYKNREGKLILLDDADGFITNKDQDIQNFLKACLDPDMHPVTTSATIRANANRILQKEWEATQKKLGESEITVDTSRIHEGTMACAVNGQYFEWGVNLEEAKELFNTFGAPETMKRYKESKEKLTRWAIDADGKLKLTESSANPDDGMSDEEAAEFEAIWGGERPEDELLDIECPEIPATWQFKSSLILISNLRLNDVNEAVRSRCQCVELTLTREEFLCRAESIIDKIGVGDDSSNDPQTVAWAKRESFAVFKSILGATGYSGTGFDDVVINIPLEFRLVATMTGAWLARYDRWCDNKGIKNPDSIEAYEQAEDELMVPFIDYDLKKILAGDTRPKKKRG